MPIQFDKKLSLDGVAIIVATIGVIIWLSRLGATVDAHSSTLLEHQQQIQKISDTENAIQQNLAVLTALQEQKQKP